eukprot:Pgem_evm1s11696
MYQIFIGIIDILTTYGKTRRIEYGLKKVKTLNQEISISNPLYYAKRFSEFLLNYIFQPEGGRNEEYTFPLYYE